MQYSILGSSGLSVSRVCLGTMTWGQQNTQADADSQLALALAAGVNFIDTAEMYAIPPRPETYGATEKIIGHWLSRNRNQRDKLVIATKIAGNGLSHIRDGSNVSPATLVQAVEGSLQRLNTDYIDLYQLHWPNRRSPHFGRHAVNQIPFSNVDAKQQQDEILAILQTLAKLVQQGKIRHCGLSNETPWGISQYLKLSEQHNLPRMVSIQNEFGPLHTKDWPYLIEQCQHENIAYLPWSPLAGGALTGKYLGGARPEGSRWSLVQRNGLFRDTPQSNAAIRAFVDLAAAHQLSPTQLALAWVNQVDGVTSTIIGATCDEQLNENLAAFDLELHDDVLEEVGSFLREHPAPF
ncbi:aldo/keto reductase [Alishewanella tabrizica]|uniref:Aldo/keto reductase n=1 Tax=Alishewanella tabrizica TaxID=671278 RepID=A0ABQ2WE85_9ALTE|nr:aldo/keto reductase [Alishewanella tabrizica]GGW49463.1 aldo/keto reductase [Alishewanella tabrizica]